MMNNIIMFYKIYILNFLVLKIYLLPGRLGYAELEGIFPGSPGDPNYKNTMHTNVN